MQGVTEWWTRKKRFLIDKSEFSEMYAFYYEILQTVQEVLEKETVKIGESACNSKKHATFEDV